MTTCRRYRPEGARPCRQRNSRSISVTGCLLAGCFEGGGIHGVPDAVYRMAFRVAGFLVAGEEVEGPTPEGILLHAVRPRAGPEIGGRGTGGSCEAFRVEGEPGCTTVAETGGPARRGFLEIVKGHALSIGKAPADA